MAESVLVREHPHITWRVRNISSDFQLPMRFLRSNAFRFDRTWWRFTLEKMADEYVTVSLARDVSEASRHAFNINTSISGWDGTFLFQKTCHALISGCKRREIWRESAKSLRQGGLVVANRTVTFVFIFTFDRNYQGAVTEDKEIQTLLSARTIDCLENLSADLLHLLDGNSQSDIVLKCEGHTIPAHRNILAARSQVFDAMLRNNMVESRTGVIQVPDMDPSVLIQFVEYIYSGNVRNLSTDNAPELYAAADKYAIASLKESCAVFLKENLTQENACPILVLADAHNDTDLKEQAISYIIDTMLSQMDDVWQKFCNEYPKLGCEVLSRAYQAKCCTEQP